MREEWRGKASGNNRRRRNHMWERQAEATTGGEKIGEEGARKTKKEGTVGRRGKGRSVYGRRRRGTIGENEWEEG